MDFFPRHIFSVLKWSGTNAKEYGSMHTALLHISCLLRYHGISFIQVGTYEHNYIFVYSLISHILRNFLKFLWTECRSLQGGHFIDVKCLWKRTYIHNEKWWFNYWSNTLILAICQRINNEYKQKYGDVFLINDENILYGDHFITIKSMKTY